MVDFAFFEALDRHDAEALLHDYLTAGAAEAGSLVERAHAEGVAADWSISTLPEVFGWVVERLTALPRSQDEALPAWIRSTASYAQGLYDFDAPSTGHVLSLSYYLGETFVRSFPTLEWSVGAPDTAQVNQPVVAGFAHGMELATILVTENLCRAMTEGEDVERVRVAVTTWSGFLSA